jgi:hypothetical protein
MERVGGEVLRHFGEHSFGDFLVNFRPQCAEYLGRRYQHELCEGPRTGLAI